MSVQISMSCHAANSVLVKKRNPATLGDLKNTIYSQITL